MATSNVTKKALASALKSLMDEAPLSKISIGDICERCHLNRKSFYYHFEDKYDLVNWIFDTDFLQAEDNDDIWVFLEDLCSYFYSNLTFYRRVLKVTAPNPFMEHFGRKFRTVLVTRLEKEIPAELMSEFRLTFYTDAMICAIERWLLDKEPMHYSEFVAQLHILVEGGAGFGKIASVSPKA